MAPVISGPTSSLEHYSDNIDENSLFHRYNYEFCILSTCTNVTMLSFTRIFVQLYTGFVQITESQRRRNRKRREFLEAVTVNLHCTVLFRFTSTLK